MPILLSFSCIFVAAIVPISQLKLFFMDRNDLFIKGSLKVTITFESNSGVSVLVPFDADCLFRQVISALMCGNDVHIYHQFEQNQVLE